MSRDHPQCPHFGGRRAAGSEVRLLLEDAATTAQVFLDQRAEQTARRLYVSSLYWGVVISAAVLVVVGGATGAVVSTILRVSNIDKIDYRVVSLRTAVLRIILGWLFAAAVLFLIKGTIVTVFKVPANESSAESLFFWAGSASSPGSTRNLVSRTDAD